MAGGYSGRNTSNRFSDRNHTSQSVCDGQTHLDVAIATVPHKVIILVHAAEA